MKWKFVLDQFVDLEFNWINLLKFWINFFDRICFKTEKLIGLFFFSIETTIPLYIDCIIKLKQLYSTNRKIQNINNEKKKLK